MLYRHQIEVTEESGFTGPTVATPGNDWQIVVQAGAAEEFDGTAAAHGRQILYDWLEENEYVDGRTISYVNDSGLSMVRVRVAFGEDPDAFVSTDNVAAVVDCNSLLTPPWILAPLERARENKLYADLLGTLADRQLSEALTTAKATGQYSKNALADFVYPAVSRPTALKMIKNVAQVPAPAARPYTLRRTAEPRSNTGSSHQPEATYEVVMKGKVVALVNKYIDRKNHKTKNGRTKFIPLTYWTFELEHGVNDGLGYETRGEAVKWALEMIEKQASTTN